MIEIKFDKSVEKFFAKNKKMEIRFKEQFKRFANEIELNNFNIVTLQTNIDIIRMKGLDSNKYRLRVGKYRAKFIYLNQEPLIRVVDLESRGSIY